MQWRLDYLRMSECSSGRMNCKFKMKNTILCKKNVKRYKRNNTWPPNWQIESPKLAEHFRLREIELQHIPGAFSFISLFPCFIY
jgi:hypothetical protein